jgi:hypothetical protein
MDDDDDDDDNNNNNKIDGKIGKLIRVVDELNTVPRERKRE